MSLSELLDIFDSLLDIIKSNKLFTKKDLTSIIRSESYTIWSVLLNYGISKRKSIGKAKLIKNILSKVSDKLVGNT